MKLRVIAENEKGNKVNLHLRQEDKLYLPGAEFEVNDIQRAKELLNTIVNGKPVVEKVKESKIESENKEN